MANNKQTSLGRFPHFKLFLFLAVVFGLVLTVVAANTKTNTQQHAAAPAIRIVGPTPRPPTPTPTCQANSTCNQKVCGTPCGNCGGYDDTPGRGCPYITWSTTCHPENCTTPIPTPRRASPTPIPRRVSPTPIPHRIPPGLNH
jgi:hypothetical protein